jgi:hypothetical protein
VPALTDEADNKLIPERDIEEDDPVIWIGLLALVAALVVGGAIAGWRLLPITSIVDDTVEVAALETSNSGGGSGAKVVNIVAPATPETTAASETTPVTALPAPETTVVASTVVASTVVASARVTSALAATVLPRYSHGLSSS